MTYNAFYRYGIPSQISPEAPTEYHVVTVGQDFTAIDPQSSKPVKVPSRVLNVFLPSGPQSDNGIVYQSVNGENITYYANYNGLHLIRAYKIISVGTDVDSTRLQWGT